MREDRCTAKIDGESPAAPAGSGSGIKRCSEMALASCSVCKERLCGLHRHPCVVCGVVLCQTHAHIFVMPGLDRGYLCAADELATRPGP